MASDWSGARRRLRVRWLLLLLAVAALHLLLLALLQGSLRGPELRTGPAQAPLVLVWIKPRPVQQEAAPPAPEAPPPKPVRRAEPPPMAAQPPPLQAAVPAGAAGAASVASVASAASEASAAAPATQAAASAPAGGLLDTEASRRAIREAARQRSTGEMGAAATDEKAPLSEQDKMGQEIARGARGDCLKGEYAGSGMGLFSLPFWLMAELREKCRR
jgi:type IV secretory pathway VirB10-like protein